MAKTVNAAGVITIDVPEGVRSGPVSQFSVGPSSGPLGSVVHGLRIELCWLLEGQPTISVNMGAADALQLAEEIRTAIHRRDDVKQGMR